MPTSQYFQNVIDQKKPEHYKHAYGDHRYCRDIDCVDAGRDLREHPIGMALRVNDVLFISQVNVHIKKRMYPQKSLQRFAIKRLLLICDMLGIDIDPKAHSRATIVGRIMSHPLNQPV